MKSIGILWAQYGPYHFARVSALRARARRFEVHAIELSTQTNLYRWNRPSSEFQVTSLFSKRSAESLTFSEVFFKARRVFSHLKMDLCFLPAYSPKQSLAALFAAKSLGLRTVMMNESHAGTARSNLLFTVLKRALVGLFDAALVGGTPQKEYFKSLGMAEEKIFTGYDAVDNSYFESRATDIRMHADDFRRRFGLPTEYLLSLGRFVPKKNLETLIQAFHQLRRRVPWSQTHLVMVGSGDQESRLRNLCWELRIPAYDKSAFPDKSNQDSDRADVEPGVHFYGFRQLQENPVFYSLAKAFILPSRYEEWGLVVNEAMASAIPVIVSRTAGCARDLLVPAATTNPNERQNGFVFDPNSSDALGLILEKIDSKPELIASMGAASRRIIQDFSCEKFAQKAAEAAERAFQSNEDYPCDISTSLNRSSL